eukprot:TRINITY_DN112550_c0_g1_i1.p1 TRINITY_DN112550_c0_g1~~TRINITY_DN112550_c0_g1_i1.p1  ORF type:complete len:187 (-),score=27.28 TRINITY_DN112550_c0_g1_i1:5-565(-)
MFWCCCASEEGMPVIRLSQKTVNDTKCSEDAGELQLHHPENPVKATDLQHEGSLGRAALLIDIEANKKIAVTLTPVQARIADIVASAVQETYVEFTEARAIAQRRYAKLGMTSQPQESLVTIVDEVIERVCEEERARTEQASREMEEVRKAMSEGSKIAKRRALMTSAMLGDVTPGKIDRPETLMQ